MSAADARDVIERAIAAGVFPAATLEAGSSVRPIFVGALGAEAQTPFDLASLTKVIATTTLVQDLVRTAALDLAAPVSGFFGDWRGADRETVTIRDLLEHASGLPARLVDQPPATRREFEHDICTMPLEYAPRTRSIYSDLGFILLGFLAADRGGAPLDVLFDRIRARLTPAPDALRLEPRFDLLTFKLPSDLRRSAAPTRPMEDDLRRGRMLAGEVHDNYAAALGGVAGHAGLFGTAPAVGAFARTVLRASRGDDGVLRDFLTKSRVPGSSRALGWDTMLPTSSCGTRMSPQAFGHVGFTGTSLWIDPVRDRYFVLLTNRVAGGGTLDQMRTVRRAFHDALGDV